MTASRVFVKGLPPSYTEPEFRDYFSKRYNVTDAKLFPARRIGYVGFKTPEDATAAIKYFNKSFIRMSKISVEYADNNVPQKVARAPTSRAVVAASINDAIGQPDTAALKRKRDEALTSNKSDAKFQEYLGLMKAPSTLKTWQADNHAVQSEAQPEDVEDEAPGTEDRPTPPTKRSKHEPEKNSNPAQDGSATAMRNKDSFLKSLPEQKPVVGPERPEEMEENNMEDVTGIKSDADWMRSRTSRLLGLVEDDDEKTENGPQQDSASPPAAELQNDTAGGNAEDQDPETEQHSPTHDSVDADADSEALRKSGRLFLRNLSYAITEPDLRELFQSFGPLDEVHVPLDSRTGDLKGFAFVQYIDHDHAVPAFKALDGTVFQGRLLHILPAAIKRESKLDDFALSKLPLKKQKQIQRKSEASSKTFNWNSLYMNADAVLSSIADRLGVAKSEVFDPTASDAAVKQAQAETHIIQETKSYFEANGVDLGAFSSKERGETAILVKNFPYGTTADELKKLFAEHGDATRVLMPPSGTIAIIEFKIVTQARAAFHSLAYRKFKDSVLFLEKAPKDLFRAKTQASVAPPAANEVKASTNELLQREADELVDTSSLYVRNLNFSTTSEKFAECFKPLDGFLSARVNIKPDPKHAGQTLSMGFGFLEFRTADQARAAQMAMNGYSLDGHQLVIKASHKAYDAAEARKQADQTKKKQLRKAKIIIKNLPFEASKKDLQNLFKAYGQLRAIRVPKKFDSSRKGFAFAEFTTAREAESAMEALRDTHLLGRRLILEYAAGESEDPEKEIEKLQQKVGRQSNSVALQKLTATERRKFNMPGGDEAEG